MTAPIQDPTVIVGNDEVNQQIHVVFAMPTNHLVLSIEGAEALATQLFQRAQFLKERKEVDRHE
jgi:hypothetical protein